MSSLYYLSFLVFGFFEVLSDGLSLFPTPSPAVLPRRRLQCSHAVACSATICFVACSFALAWSGFGFGFTCSSCPACTSCPACSSCTSCPTRISCHQKVIGNP
uniref:Uncharacterized protein n=1 Tax=Oreochromis niloticus TaxID=8128 RepID=A0A669DM90_ORENI